MDRVWRHWMLVRVALRIPHIDPGGMASSAGLGGNRTANHLEMQAVAKASSDCAVHASTWIRTCVTLIAIRRSAILRFHEDTKLEVFSVWNLCKKVWVSGSTVGGGADYGVNRYSCLLAPILPNRARLLSFRSREVVIHLSGKDKPLTSTLVRHHK